MKAVGGEVSAEATKGPASLDSLQPGPDSYERQASVGHNKAKSELVLNVLPESVESQCD
mgnify:CR=1